MRISDWSSDVCSSDLQIYTPNGDYEPLINGKRRRIGLQGAFQWKPNPDLEIFAEAGYQEFRSLQQQRGLNNPTNGRAVDPDTVTLYEGTSDFKSGTRSEEHTSELQSLMRISYAVFCLKKQKHKQKITTQTIQQYK